MCHRYLRAFIHFLDNDSLLHIFYLCRPALLEGDKDVAHDHCVEWKDWSSERWWYKPAHVCRRWRNLILASASHLGLSLLCTYDTPVTDMLSHSPPLPLIIDPSDKPRDIAVEGEDRIMLALHHRDRVHHIRLRLPFPKLQKLIDAAKEEFPMLETLCIGPPYWTKHSSGLILPDTFQALNLIQLILINFAFPIGSPLLMTATGLVTLSLQNIHPSANHSPHDLLQQLSLLPQLKRLQIGFHSPLPSRDVETQLLHRPIITHVTLPNLHSFRFKGVSAYLEVLLPRMTTPLLKRLQIFFFFQLSLSLTHLLPFVSSASDLKFGSATFSFRPDMFGIVVCPHRSSWSDNFSLKIFCHGHLDWQIAFAIQSLRALRTVFSAVEHLTLDVDRTFQLSEADRTQWRELLMLFKNVKTLVLKDSEGMIGRSLQVDDGESPTEMLPELKELRSDLFGHDDSNAVNTFIDARRHTGRPVTLLLE